jgi:hypothetical protein
LHAHAQLLEYPGRPALTTWDNNTPNPKPGLLQYIPAVQTRPFNITSANSTPNSSSSSSSGQLPSDSSASRVGLSACWEEELCVDAAPEQLAESDALLLLELLQLPGGFSRYKVRHSAVWTAVAFLAAVQSVCSFFVAVHSGQLQTAVP